MNNKYKVAIIGAGSIGALKPDKYDSPTTENILTHAHAVYDHPQMELTAIIDKDYDKAQTACEKWRKKETDIYPVALNKIDPLICSINFKEIDIFIVSSPTETHYEILKKISEYQPKVVIAEKPFCSNIEEANEIIQLYQKKDIPLAVNYTRRYDPLHQELAKLAQTNSLAGKAEHCRVIYTRGIRREASHIIDLMNWFFGSVISGVTLDDKLQNPILCDYSVEDPSYNINLKYERCPSVLLTAVDGRDYSIFEIDIIGSKGRVILIDHGIYCNFFKVKPEPNYGDYNTLDSVVSEMRHGSLTTALLNLLYNVVDYLEKKANLLCSAEDALKVHFVYEMLGV